MQSKVEMSPALEMDAVIVDQEMEHSYQDVLPTPLLAESFEGKVTAEQLLANLHVLQGNNKELMINAPRVRYAAVLPPVEWDNYKFWALVHKRAHRDVDNILRAANQAGLINRYGELFFPSLDQLLPQILNKCSSPEVVLECIKLSSRNDENQPMIGRIEEYIQSIGYLNELLAESSPHGGGEAQGLNHQNDLNPPAPPPPGGAGPQPVFYGKPLPKTSASIWLKVLGGFMMALGVAAVVVAFAALNAATFATAGLIVAGAGVAVALAGVGLFAYGFKNKFPQIPLPPPGTPNNNPSI